MSCKYLYYIIKNIFKLIQSENRYYRTIILKKVHDIQNSVKIENQFAENIPTHSSLRDSHLYPSQQP